MLSTQENYNLCSLTEGIPKILYIKYACESYYLNKTGDILPGDILEGYNRGKLLKIKLNGYQLFK